MLKTKNDASTFRVDSALPTTSEDGIPLEEAVRKRPFSVSPNSNLELSTAVELQQDGFFEGHEAQNRLAIRPGYENITQTEAEESTFKKGLAIVGKRIAAAALPVAGAYFVSVPVGIVATIISLMTLPRELSEL